MGDREDAKAVGGQASAQASGRPRLLAVVEGNI